MDYGLTLLPDNGYSTAKNVGGTLSYMLPLPSQPSNGENLLRHYARDPYLELRKKAFILQWEQIFLQEYLRLDEDKTDEDLREISLTNTDYAALEKMTLE